MFRTTQISLKISETSYTLSFNNSKHSEDRIKITGQLSRQDNALEIFEETRSIYTTWSSSTARKKLSKSIRIKGIAKDNVFLGELRVKSGSGTLYKDCVANITMSPSNLASANQQ